MASDGPKTPETPIFPDYSKGLLESRVGRFSCGVHAPTDPAEILSIAWQSAWRARGCAHVLHQFIQQMNQGGIHVEEWHMDHLEGMIDSLQREIADTLTLIGFAEPEPGRGTP